MCMRMLNRRAHILFEEEDYKLLEFEAVEKDSSVGSWSDWRSNRFMLNLKMRLWSVGKSLSAIDKWQEKIGVFKGLDYKALVEYGRVR